MGRDHMTSGRDSVFAAPGARASDFEFNEEVAGVFDDMLVRSVPCYLEQQGLIREIATRFHVPGTKIYDLGCSTGTTLLNIGHAIDDSVELVGYDNSKPMLERARQNVARSGLANPVDLRYADLNVDASDLDLDGAGVITLCWTLQFIRPLGRNRLIRQIYDSLGEGGVLICCEKILTNDSDMNRFFVDFYSRISDFAVVPYRQDQSPRLDFWGSDARTLTTEGDTRWVNYNMSHFSSRSTAS